MTELVPLNLNPLLLNPAKSNLSQWFLNLLSNQAEHAKLVSIYTNLTLLP